MYVPTSYAITGEGYRWENIGAMMNRGVEVAVDGNVIHTKDFTWNLSANFSYNKNKLLELLQWGRRVCKFYDWLKVYGRTSYN